MFKRIFGPPIGSFCACKWKYRTPFIEKLRIIIRRLLGEII